MNADALFKTLMERLHSAHDKPAGLTLAPFPVMDLDTTELPYMGLRLTEGDHPTGEGEDMRQGGERSSQIMVEIWAKGEDPLSATEPFRHWAAKHLFHQETWGVHRVEMGGFQSEIAYADGWVGLAVLSFTFFYFWSPHE